MTHHELPLPDYDNLPVGSLESRIRTLDADDIQTLLDYERQHANRVAVVQILQRRAEALANGAEPSGGSPLATTPETDTTPPGDAQPPRTDAPPVNPPSQGVPTNPAQPRR
jgi:hypothetical protein